MNARPSASGKWPAIPTRIDVALEFGPWLACGISGLWPLREASISPGNYFGSGEGLVENAVELADGSGQALSHTVDAAVACVAGGAEARAKSDYTIPSGRSMAASAWNWRSTRTRMM